MTQQATDTITSRMANHESDKALFDRVRLFDELSAFSESVQKFGEQALVLTADEWALAERILWLALNSPALKTTIHPNGSRTIQVNV